MKQAMLCCLLAACATTSGAPKPTAAARAAAEFYPLEPGTEWTYEVALLGGKQEQQVKLLERDGEGFVRASTGEELLADDYGVRDRKRYLLRNPVVAGTKWTNVVSVSSIERYEILAVDQPCEAPAGTWEGCVVVESRNRVDESATLVNELTFAPGVGIVQISTVLEHHDQRVPQSTLRLLTFVAPH